MPDTSIRGLACDHACLEISVNGAPVPEAFSSVDPKCSKEFEKLYLNGKSSARQRSQGKLDAGCDVETPVAQFYSLVNERLGGQGEDPEDPAFMHVEFSMLLSFRPKNAGRLYQLEYTKVIIKDWSLSSSSGKAAMVKMSLDALGVRVLP